MELSDYVGDMVDERRRSPRYVAARTLARIRPALDDVIAI